MTQRRTPAHRAQLIAAAIGRFEQGTTEGAHDGRLIADNLGVEAGFGGSPASRRQQIQQYFARFPELRQRWRTAGRDAAARAGRPRADLAADLAAARAEAARLRVQLTAMSQVADLLRRKAERLERQSQQPGSPTPAGDLIALPPR